MKAKLSLLLLIIVLSNVNAQLDECASHLICRVTAPSGMRFRAQPSLKAKVVSSVPYDTLVKACSKTYGAMTYEGIEGFWRKITYKGKTGYMFDGFMEIRNIIRTADTTRTVEMDSTAMENDTAKTITIKDTIPEEEEIIKAHEVVQTKATHPSTQRLSYSLLTEAYNFCGDIRNIDPGLLWYAFYPKDEDGPGTLHRIETVEVEIVKSKYNVGNSGLEFDIKTDKDERSLFMIGLNKPLDVKSLALKDHSEQLRFTGRKVFPGQQLTLTKLGSPISLSATGSVQSTGPCPDLKGYKLLLSGEKYYLNITQDITEEIVYTGQCGMPEIYWYGDFTNDGVPEIIFVSVYDEKNRFTLFISDPSREDILVRKEVEWVIDKCY